MQTLAFIPNLGPQEMVIILILALLLFGRRLPEVGRSLGKGIVEFKRGVKGITDEIEAESDRPGDAGQESGESASPAKSSHKGWEAIEPAPLSQGQQTGTVGQGERPAEAPMQPDQQRAPGTGEEQG